MCSDGSNAKIEMEDEHMKKILALVLALAMILAATAALADGIKVGIINLDPSESGYRQANVKDLQDTFTAENGYDASFATSWKPPRPSSPMV